MHRDRPHREPPLRTRLAAFAALAALTLAPAAARAAWDPIPPEAWTEAARPDSGGADAIVLDERQACRQTESSFTMDYFARARVFTADGRDVGDLEIYTIKKEWKLANLRARAVRPDGSAVELDPSTVVTTTAWKYRDYEVLKSTVSIPGIEPGCIVEWGYTLSGPLSYFSGWRFQFSNRYYTCRSSAVWNVPKDIWGNARPVWRYNNLTAGKAHEECTPSRESPTQVAFTVRAIDGVRGEAYAPPSSDARPRVDVRCESRGAEPTMYWSGWKAAFDAYQEAVGKDDRVVTKLADGFKAAHPDPADALRAAFAWIQSTFTNLDDRGWAGRDAAARGGTYAFAESFRQMTERKALSSFELNLLFVAIARKLGVSACLGLTGDRELQRFDMRTMGLPPENAVTRLTLAGQPVFCQAGGRFARFGSLPWNLRAGDCLFSGSTNDLFGRVSADDGDPAIAEWTVDANLSEEGTLEGTLRARLAGEEEAQWKRDLWEMDPAKWTGELADRVAAGGGPKATFEAPDLGPPGDSLLSLSATARWPAIAIAEDGRVEIPCEKLLPWCTHERFLSERRTQPILLHYPRHETFRLTLHLPAGYAVPSLPAPASFENEIGAWTENWSAAGDRVTLVRELVIVRAEWPQRLYPAVREWFGALDRADHAVLVAEKAK